MSRAQERPRAPLVRLSYRKGESAAVLGISEDHFATIAHEIPCVRRGRVTLYSAAALARWLEEHSERWDEGRA